jgi:hypothetical protein
MKNGGIKMETITEITQLHYELLVILGMISAGIVGYFLYVRSKT